MEKMNDLLDLLKHEIQDLYSVEEQIIEAMPNMIDSATNQQLKTALKDHLRITEKQKARLKELQAAMGEEIEEENQGLFDRLFKTKSKCKGMQGIIEEGNKILEQEMDPDVMDAAIIACAQKIEHYEICGYGTAKAYARELKMPDIEKLLDQTLNEEYDADDKLTALAVGRLNRKAETAGETPSRRSNGSNGRSGSQERATRKEPELETASSPRSGNGNGSSRGSSAPKGSASSRSSSSNGRSSSKSNTSSASNSRSSKSSGKSSGRNGSSTSRGGSSSGRSNGRKS